jgi:hypothetical protein
MEEQSGAVEAYWAYNQHAKFLLCVYALCSLALAGRVMPNFLPQCVNQLCIVRG